MIINIGKVGLLDSLKYNAFAGIEVRTDSGCWSLFSKVCEILPNKDAGISMYVATVTFTKIGLVIYDESMLILFILCVASELILCSVFVAYLQLYIMLISLFTFTSELFRVIPSPSSKCVT